jgi:hypothetical protein
MVRQISTSLSLKPLVQEGLWVCRTIFIDKIGETTYNGGKLKFAFEPKQNIPWEVMVMENKTEIRMDNMKVKKVTVEFENGMTKVCNIFVAVV